MNKRIFFGTLAAVALLLAACGTSGGTKGTAEQTNRGSAPAQEIPVEPGLVQISGGTFTMGSPANERDRRPSEEQHQVTVSAFSLGKYPVTQKEYQEVMGTNPSEIKGINLPVTNVSWFDAVDYCNRLSQKEGLTPAYTIIGWGNNVTVDWNRNANGYRLPTEAEWEYACRAGTTTSFSTGNTWIARSQANYNELHDEKPTPVNNFEPNPWGLYDMHGNAYEWCWDWYGDYPSEAQTDPAGPPSGKDGHVMRGGSFRSVEWQLRSANRGLLWPDYDRAETLGFRVAASR